MEPIAVEAVPFEDFIDGYFPLGQSLRYLLDRRGFASAWIVMRVAPVMEIPGLRDHDPVPLHIDSKYEGQIDWLSASVRRSGSTAGYFGAARWAWNEPALDLSNVLSPVVRLAEPAFIRGIGFLPGDLQTEALGAIRGTSGRTAVSILMQNDNMQGRLSESAGAIDRVIGLHPRDLKRLTEPHGEKPDVCPESLVLEGSDPVIARILADEAKSR